MKVLLFSFEPSTPGHTNSGVTTAEWIVEGLVSEYPETANCLTVVLPLYFSCREKLKRKIDSFQPDIVIGFHVSPGKPWVMIEQCALNIIHTHHYPNWADQDRHMTPIYQNGAGALFTRADTVDLVEMLREHGVPADHSFHCGTGIANYSYYIALQEMDLENTVFIHVPQSPEEGIVQGRPVPVFPPWKTAQGIIKWISKSYRKGDQE